MATHSLWFVRFYDPVGLLFTNGLLIEGKLHPVPDVERIPGGYRAPRFLYAIQDSYDSSAALSDRVFRWIDSFVNDPAYSATHRRGWYTLLRSILLPESRVNFIYHIVGPAGTGKTTFIKLLTYVCGESAVAGIGMENISYLFGLSNLIYKRFLVIADASDDVYRGRNAVASLKKLSGRDSLTLNRKFKDEVQGVVYRGDIIVTSNTPPQTYWDDGLNRRIVELNLSRTPENRDPLFIRQLEKEVSGFINYIRSLPDDELSIEEVQAYNSESDPLTSYVSDWLTSAEGSFMTYQDLRILFDLYLAFNDDF